MRVALGQNWGSKKFKKKKKRIQTLLQKALRQAAAAAVGVRDPFFAKRARRTPLHELILEEKN